MAEISLENFEERALALHQCYRCLCLAVRKLSCVS